MSEQFTADPAATDVRRRAPQRYLARSLEWLWRGEALLATTTETTGQAAPLAARQRDRAEVAYRAAVRLSRTRGRFDASLRGESATSAHEAPLSAPLVLSLYRESAYWALCAAAGGRDAPSLSSALARLAPELALSPAWTPDKLSAARDVLERDRGAAAALDVAASARDTRLARELVETLLQKLGAREERELSLLRERVLRVAGLGALLLVALCAVVMVPRALRPDLAENARWRVSSSMPGHAMSGTGGRSAQARVETPSPNVAGETTLFFHTLEEVSPWIEFDLGRVRSLHRVRLVNRADCCWERVAPLAIEVSADRAHFREVARRDELFYDWSTSLGGAQARYLRVRALRQTMLHLTRVEIY